VCVEGQDGGAEVVRAGLDPGGVEVAHLGEDLVDVDHESGDLVEAGFVAGGEILVRVASSKRKSMVAAMVVLVAVAACQLQLGKPETRELVTWARL